MKNTKGSGNNVKVVCRFRPLIDIEIELGALPREIYSFPTDEAVTTADGESFTFDKVYPTSAQQGEIFEFVGKPIVDDVLIGYNGTVIAYGQTGAGKSFTMMGLDIYNPETQGLIPRAIKLIFESVEKAGQEAEFTLKCSMLEIYKEKLKDLCGDSSDLKIKENKAKGIYVDGLTEIYVASEEEMLGVLAMGERNRTVASTKMNNVSSRSHQLFILEVKQKLPNDSEKRGILNLVDLAGSEKINQTGVTGNKLEEAKKINLSLSALGNVIKSLTSNAEHIPYRDSKLTRLLQESLGGNYKTTLIVNCSPHPRNSEDTLNTLKFAQRAKTIKNQVRMNIKKSAEAYIKIIEDLKNQLRKAFEEVEFWKHKAGQNNNVMRRRASSLKGTIDLKGLKIPEVDADDDQSSSSQSQSPLPEETSNSEDLREKNSELVLENEELKQKVRETSDLLAKETVKRLETEKKYFECYDNYTKLVLSITDSSNKHEYLYEENASLVHEIEMLNNHIQILTNKFNSLFKKIKNGENFTGWEFSENSESISGIPIYTKDMQVVRPDEKKTESSLEILVDPEALLAQDTYAQEICLALEESSLINQDIVIFELKKQIINSGMVNCELFRILTDMRLQKNLFREKLNLKVKLSEFYEAKSTLYEKMLTNLERSFEKLVKLAQKSKIIKVGSSENGKKAKIARPIKGMNFENPGRGSRRLTTVSSITFDNKKLLRQNTASNEVNSKDFQYRTLESTVQIQGLYNNHIKNELELVKNERNKYRELYDKLQSEYVDVYTKEKVRWKKYLEQFKDNCNHELIRKQAEINKLNVQIAHWMNLYLEIQQGKAEKCMKAKINEHKRNFSSIDPVVIDKTLQVQLLHSPLHVDSKQSRLAQLNSKQGDISPLIFAE